MIRAGAVLRALRPGAEWTLSDSTKPVMANLVMHSDEPTVTQAEYDAMAAEMATEQPWVDIRAERDILLRDSDWRMGNDTPLSEADQAAWGEYRESLRNIPQDFTTPKKFGWPKKPKWPSTPDE